ncbi:MAG: 2-phospho-L-lactate guanylyltransferase [Alphaproteobacteria bacterium]|nr:2-phospho-L-lactate guanylyltransferase [Alphaproteobacteria bacterium]
MTAGLWALVPVKELGGVKSRLAGLLSAAQRRDLVVAMAADVLRALVGSRRVEHVVLVSGTPELARLTGIADVVSYPGPCTCGLNADLTAAAHWAHRAGARQLLIVHADLPLLTSAAIDRFVGARQNRRERGLLRAARCSKGSGTNLLLAPLPLPLPLSFGAHSLARFRDLAAARGLTFEIRDDPALGTDIDISDDHELLERLFRSGGLPQGATAALLRARSVSAGRLAEAFS